jgi:hypothetical protein
MHVRLWNVRRVQSGRSAASRGRLAVRAVAESAPVLGRSEAGSPSANELFHIAVCSRVVAGRRPAVRSAPLRGAASHGVRGLTGHSKPPGGDTGNNQHLGPPGVRLQWSVHREGIFGTTWKSSLPCARSPFAEMRPSSGAAGDGVEGRRIIPYRRSFGRGAAAGDGRTPGTGSSTTDEHG